MIPARNDSNDLNFLKRLNDGVRWLSGCYKVYAYTKVYCKEKATRSELEPEDRVRSTLRKRAPILNDSFILVSRHSGMYRAKSRIIVAVNEKYLKRK